MIIWPGTDGAKNGDVRQTPEKTVGNDIDGVVSGEESRSERRRGEMTEDPCGQKRLCSECLREVISYWQRQKRVSLIL